jgi:hypothetical protein
MDGFDTLKQILPKCRYSLPRLPLLFAGTAIALGLCFSSGCATMQGARKDLHLATCVKARSNCDCSCGECTSEFHGAQKTTVHGENATAAQAAGQHDFVIPPGSQTDGELTGAPSKVMMIDGMLGKWTPDRPNAADQGHAELPATAFDRLSNGSQNMQPPANSQNQGFPMQATSPGASSQGGHYPGPYYPAEMTRRDEEFKEYHTKFHVLSEQISHMMQTLESMKASQETFQQSQEREILALKLQQATADRDRLEREHKLDRELQDLRKGGMQTIDTITQIMENVAPIPAPPIAAANGNSSSAQRAASQLGQEQSTASQELPTVDGSR